MSTDFITGAININNIFKERQLTKSLVYDNYTALSMACGYFPTVLATFLRLSRRTKHSLRVFSRRTRRYSMPSISLTSVGLGQTNRSLFTMFSKWVDFILFFCMSVRPVGFEPTKAMFTTLPRPSQHTIVALGGLPIPLTVAYLIMH